MSDLIKHSTDSNFDADVLQADLPVIVDYWAPWCGPCKAIAPILEELAQEYQGRLQVIKVDVQDYPDIAARFGIRSIPTLKIFKNGQDIATKVGSVSKSQLASFIDGAI